MILSSKTALIALISSGFVAGCAKAPPQQRDADTEMKIGQTLQKERGTLRSEERDRVREEERLRLQREQREALAAKTTPESDDDDRPGKRPLPGIEPQRVEKNDLLVKDEIPAAIPSVASAKSPVEMPTVTPIDDSELYESLDGVWLFDSRKTAVDSDPEALRELQRGQAAGDSQIGALGFAVNTSTKVYLANFYLLDKNETKGRNRELQWQGPFRLTRAKVKNREKMFLEITFNESESNGSRQVDFKPTKIVFALADLVFTPERSIKTGAFAVAKRTVPVSWWDEKYDGVYLICEKQKAPR